MMWSNFEQINNNKFVIVVVGVVSIVVVLWISLRRFEHRSLYYPDKVLIGTPDVAGLRFKDVVLETSDREKIHAWFVYTNEKRRSTVVFCHGNAGNISSRLEKIHILCSLGFDVLIFDYRGYGQSTGRPSEKGTYADADAAY